ncbi:MAG TPA: alanine--tRNA ligase [Solirubrobacteraceae bacterium]|nr:alanine--tRNA ligase [Solirubrobacteraceae bacterium]
MMGTDEIRERYLAFFEERGHLRIPSGSLVPSAHDPSALFTVAGMHPLKPYFLGQEQPPALRLTDCQKVFRTVDIDNVGSTPSHLTFFEMLGNFAFGDYFKREAIRFAWELSLEVFGFAPQDIWVTVFEGDDALGIGPDEEAIEHWLEIGVPRERIVLCARSENFWQAGPTGPCGPCSELYIDRGSGAGAEGELPGGEGERFLEYWNLVFMQYDLIAEDGRERLEELPAQNIDTGLGLNRMAAIMQDVGSVFETDQFKPLVALGEELSGTRYGDSHEVDRALRILSDHSRAMTFLIADGVVPSNEDRGYVLRRVMRRAILQGKNLELEPGFLLRYAERVREVMGGYYPELHANRDAISTWVASEEEAFGRTLAQGMATLSLFIEQARDAGRSTVPAIEVFRLHDTFGFPREVTEELLSAQGLEIEGDVEPLMEEQRERSRAVAARGERDGAGARPGDERAAAASFAGSSGFRTEFTGYQTERQHTTVGAVALQDGRYLVKLAESPFYAAGGGQIADAGTIECEHGDCRARVEDVFRLGDDQALAVTLERGTLEVGEPVIAAVDHLARHATECNHTATHLLQAALRSRLGPHVRQAGSYVGPDKLRFDFSHGRALSADELAGVEDLVNDWIARNDPVRAITTTLEEARRLGAMALFGEKYGDVVRMVEVGDGSFSRELCGGTHVRSTAEIGLFKITHETSSAANVRRIEAVTGPVAVGLLIAHDRALDEAAQSLRVPPARVADAVAELRGRVKQLERAVREGGAAAPGVDLDALVAGAAEVDGARVVATGVDGVTGQALQELADKIKAKLGDSAVVLGSAGTGKLELVATVSPALVARGVKAGAIVKAAATAVGGGGGGRDTFARAGGGEPGRLPDAIAVARAAIEAALGA